MIDHLLSVSMPAENFCVTLHKMLSDFERHTGLATQLYLKGMAAREECYNPARLPPPVAVQLVRITQEALANVRKHAQGSSLVQVTVKADDSLMELSIADDGAGFDPAAQAYRRQAFWHTGDAPARGQDWREGDDQINLRKGHANRSNPASAG